MTDLLPTDRLAIVAAVLLAIVLVPALLRAYATARARAGAAGAGATDAPTVLYFRTDDCVQCRAQQAPALDRLRQLAAGRISIRTVDAVAERDLADRFGVLTVPTTIVLDERGAVRAVNLGFASAHKLATQLELAS